MKVGDKFRENSLSKIPGGSVVTVKYKGKQPLDYDKIKDVKVYVNRILNKAKKTGEIVDIEYIKDDSGTTLYPKSSDDFNLPF
jgi:hypothetical protein